MPSLLDRIKERAREELESYDEYKIREELDAGLAKAREHLPDGGVESTERMLGDQALKVLNESKGELATVGFWGVTAIAAELAAGDGDAAVAFYVELATKAGWDELFKAIDDAQAADVEAERAHRERRKAAMNALAKIPAHVARAALPFLLKAVGL